MKNIITLILFVYLSKILGQTATNWTVTDCSGNSHELFNDLDAGKVAVIIWVMPCVSCINGALSAQTEVQNALVNNPGMVVYYLADDVANTNCATLTSWASTNGITDAFVITNQAVSMSPYGAAGMPKVVVIGRDHKVYYNQNAPALNANGIKGGIAAALAAPTGISKNSIPGVKFDISPNPSSSSTEINLSLSHASDVKIEVFNEIGQVVAKAIKGQLSPGIHKYKIDSSEWANGTYFISAIIDGKKIQEKLVVAH